MDISKREKVAYFALWIGGVLYAIYGVVKARKAFENYDDVYGDFKQGWLVSNVKKDSADYEWETTLQLLRQAWPWFVAHVAVSEYLRKKHLKVLPYWQLLISVLFITHSAGLGGAAVILIQPTAFECARKFRSKVLVWVCAGASLAWLCFLKTLDSAKEGKFDETQQYLIIVASCWINLRCLSYYLDSADAREHDVVRAMSYCLYLPTLFLGPFILFCNFEEGRTGQKAATLSGRVKKLACDAARFGFWFLFAELSLHYVYANALSFQPEIVKNLDSWSLYGYGYCMGQFFHLKYVVLYGLSTTLARFEHIASPSTPKCIGRIHVYSDMWRYFDEGLYRFLIKYIYLPSLRSKAFKHKMLSSFLCFLFVFVWHGIFPHVFLWAVLNYIGICIESVFAVISNSMDRGRKYFSDKWRYRLSRMILSPLLAMSAISNFYFFAGMQIGSIFVERFLFGSRFSSALLLLFLYCCCCVSTEVKKWEVVHRKSKS